MKPTHLLACLPSASSHALAPFIRIPTTHLPNCPYSSHCAALRQFPTANTQSNHSSQAGKASTPTHAASLPKRRPPSHFNSSGSHFVKEAGPHRRKQQRRRAFKADDLAHAKPPPPSRLVYRSTARVD
ncbi:hypothetical protein BC567DRAFT_205843 [Phyllosticta citribraziliensis]